MAQVKRLLLVLALSILLSGCGLAADRDDNSALQANSATSASK
jgi:uncharacterized protein YceK